MLPVVNFLRRTASKSVLPLVLAILASIVLPATADAAVSCPADTMNSGDSWIGDGDAMTCTGGGAPSNGFRIQFDQPTSIAMSHWVNGGSSSEAPICMGAGCGGNDGPGFGDCTGGSHCVFTYTYQDHTSTFVSVTISVGAGGAVTGSVSGSTFDSAPLTPQTINFPNPGALFFGSSHTLSASASSGLPVLFASSTIGVCTVSGTTLTLVQPGTCTIRADQAGDGTYDAAPQVNRSFTIHPGNQTITFNDPGPQSMGTSPTLSASSTSGLTVTFSSSTAGVCTISGTTLTPVSEGSCTIDADQAGNANYNAAMTVSRTFTITASATAQTITFANPGTQTMGTSPTLSASATSGLMVAFSSSTTGVCTVSGTTLTLVSAGSCTINANQAGNGSYAAAPQVSQTFTISAAARLAQTVTFTSTPPTDASKTYTPVAVASSGLSVTFGISGPCSISNTNVVTLVNPGQSCTITAIATSNATYETASATQTWTRMSLVQSTATVVSKTKANTIVTSQVSPIASTQTANLISGAVSNAISGGGTGGFRFGFAQGNGLNGAPVSHFSAGRNTENPDGDPFHYASAFPERGGERYSGVERFGGSAFAFRGLMQLSGDLSNGKRLNFSASLSEATSYMEQVNAAAAISAGKAPMTPRMTKNPFDVWVEGKFSTLSTQGYDGEIGSVGIGAHYLFTPKFLAGVMLQIDDAALESSSDTTETGAVGWLAGPYVAFEVAKDVIVQGRFNWGKSDRELLFAGVRDEFEGTRWIAGASISGTWTQGQWTMRPAATVVYMEDVSDSYTDVVGNVMPEVHYSAGQAAVGPQFSYRWMPSGSVMVTPRIGANILWTFTENLDIAGGNSLDGEPSGPGGLRGNVDFGLSVAWISGTSIDLSGTYDGIGVSDFESKTGRAMLNVPLN